ncbi:MAG: helix-turn-helix domain-containing protein [Bacteroides sp.]|jgi:transcriptional regulator with XRE-family HTH domain|nr:helix-turn-helix domain-containing protein [Bacteroides sp.]MCI1683269.1 helix-turn-helix domain-containing protein [Bacteroides sp.]
MVSDRIEILINKLSDGKKSQFAKRIGVAPSVIGNITGERKGNPSFEVAQKILNAFASINPDWLLFGKEPMFRQAEANSMSLHEDQISYYATAQNREADIYYKMYKEKDAENKELIKEIGRLEERLKKYEHTDPISPQKT